MIFCFLETAEEELGFLQYNALSQDSSRALGSRLEAQPIS